MNMFLENLMLACGILVPKKSKHKTKNNFGMFPEMVWTKSTIKLRLHCF